MVNSCHTVIPNLTLLNKGYLNKIVHLPRKESLQSAKVDSSYTKDN